MSNFKEIRDAQYLDRRWQQRRLEVLARANWLCEYCGDANPARQLEVHHLRYPLRGRPLWESPAEDLVALCPPCHYGELNRIDVERQWLMTSARLPKRSLARLAELLEESGLCAADLLCLVAAFVPTGFRQDGYTSDVERCGFKDRDFWFQSMLARIRCLMAYGNLVLSDLAEDREIEPLLSGVLSRAWSRCMALAMTVSPDMDPREVDLIADELRSGDAFFSKHT